MKNIIATLFVSALIASCGDDSLDVNVKETKTIEEKKQDEKLSEKKPETVQTETEVEKTTEPIEKKQSTEKLQENEPLQDNNDTSDPDSVIDLPQSEPIDEEPMEEVVEETSPEVVNSYRLSNQVNIGNANVDLHMCAGMPQTCVVESVVINEWSDGSFDWTIVVWHTTKSNTTKIEGSTKDAITEELLFGQSQPHTFSNAAIDSVSESYFAFDFENKKATGFWKNGETEVDFITYNFEVVE